MLTLLLACTADETPSGAPTWHQDVAPIVIERCTGCHTESGAAFALDSYENASMMAEAMAAAVGEGRMPPWGAVETEDCTPTHGWRDDRRLTEEQIATIEAWVEAGAPEGDPEDAAPLVDPTPVSLQDPDLEVGFSEPYTTIGEADELICFTMDPTLPGGAWFTGIEVVPGNKGIAHHALLFVDPHGEGAVTAGEDGWFDCGSGSGVNVSDGRLLATWVPGAPPTIAPDGTAIPIEPGSRLLLQMHYHPGGRAGEVDSTTVRVQTTSVEPDKGLYQTLIGNFWNEESGLRPGPSDRDGAEFRIPAGASGHTETMDYEVPAGVPPLPLVSFGAHMHLAGSSMTIKKGDECLLSVPNYDYDWQQLYDVDASLDEAPSVSGGDVITLECTYDNTLANPGVQRALSEEGLSEPVDIGLGEGTLDEMCIAMVGFVY